MSKLFDGSDEALTYGQALVAIAQSVSWPTEAHRNEVVLAVQTEHDLVPAPVDVKALLNDPRDVTLIQQDEELAKLRKQVENFEEEKKLRAQIEAARAGQ